MAVSYEQVGTFVYRASMRYGLWAVVLAWTLVSILLSVLVTAALVSAIWGSVRLPELAMSAVITALVTPPISYFVARLQLQLNQASERLQKLVNVDPLTGVASRLYFTETVGSLISEKSKQNMPACVLMIDIDNFKSINDARGHAAGDAVLRSFSDAMRQSLRDGDLLARYGGEEFAILLPNTNAAAGRELAERLRFVTVSSQRLCEIAGRAVTISVGMVSLEEGADLDLMLAAADRALYRAKNQGRDQVCETVSIAQSIFLAS